jgi:hypothetical protein
VPACSSPVDLWRAYRDVSGVTPEEYTHRRELDRGQFEMHTSTDHGPESP